jgi:hypothetical protein
MNYSQILEVGEIYSYIASYIHYTSLSYDMAHSNRPLTSRECKIMLDTNRFMDRKKGTHEISTITERLIKGQGGNFMADVEEEERRTWYLDSNAYELYHNNNFLIRIRKKKNPDEYDLTLKCRHPDRYVSASYDLTSSVKDIEIKFEEDIVTDKLIHSSVNFHFLHLLRETESQTFT